MNNSTPSAAKQRIAYFDLMKGVAIFLVVMGHALTMCIRGLDSAFTFKLISQVHMPMFFFVSGYLTYKANGNGAFKAPNLKKRFLQLIVPFLVITPLWVWYFPHSGLQSPLHDNLPDLLKAYWKDGYWFTLCLFEMFLIYFSLSALLSKAKTTMAQVAILLVAYLALAALSVTFADEEANVDYVGFGLLARFFPVFAMGVMAHKLKGAFQRFTHAPWAIAGALVVGAITFFCAAYPWNIIGQDPVIWNLTSFLTQPLLHFSVIMVAILLFEPWAKREFQTEGHRPNAISRYFNLLGNESLGIYLLHYFFLFPLTFLQQPLRDLGLQLVPMAAVAIAVAVPVIAVTLLVIFLLKQSKVTAFLFLGKS